ncbi:MAG: AAA family ATPase [Flavobacteriales bacterium]|jgi:cell division protease FtsH|nr:AAA family ATPase [Flavobacteriales bacterium]
MSVFAPSASIFDRAARIRGLEERLRTTHFGIDTEIRRLLDVFAPWYQFAETQTRPRTIGLWGMTGTGKSSLVRALVKEAGMEDRTFWLDAGESRKEYWLEDVFRLMDEQLDGTPFIVVVDEFQNARTVHREEGVRESGMLRRFWEMLDTGRVITWPDTWRRSGIKLFTDRFKKAVEAGVRVQNGRVVSAMEQFNDLVGCYYSTDDEDPDWAIPGEVWMDLRLSDRRTPLRDVRGRLSRLDQNGVLAWLAELDPATPVSRVIDASKALVVLLGNLDELYVGGKEPMAELDPEVLLHRHENIGRAGVHHALTKLFRIEQVGRIGSSHVVFPPIGADTINAIVRAEVRGLCERLTAQCKRTVAVDDNLVEHLRATSSIAVLGARPVVEAVHNTVPLLLAQAMEHAQAPAAASVRLAVEDGTPVAELLVEGAAHRMELALDTAGPPAGPDDDAHLERSAVHETGHLVCGTLLCGRRPLQVCVRTRDPQVAGFVVWDRVRRVQLRKDIVPELAGLLAGRVAEQMYYGPDAVSTGAEDDLRRATAMALDMVKSAGMGQHIFQHADHPSSEHRGFRTMLHEVEAQAKQWIEAAEALALDTLRADHALFVQCVDRLKEKGALGMAELEELIRPRQVAPATKK